MARGRPLNPEKQEIARQALREAARTLLQQKSYRSITIRELAEQAGMQSAMVSYYFGSKEGLFIDLLEQSGERRQQFLMELSRKVLSTPERAIPLLVDNVVDLLASEPWVVKLFQDEILTQESSLREHFMQAIPNRLKTYLQTLLHQLISLGILRSDLKIEFLVTTLMSNLLYPFVAEPVMSRMMNLDHETLCSREWKDHLIGILSRALENPGEQL
ncbi:TetR/AcrR family transcriptional regulator [Parendozoicomonas haliclonae]|uniref:HTH-type transcriptional repressor AcnR n=1 Tax=Parendozoicomonas haliclonae TaxID=1960125 RepID=A0A1X7AM14_9GAMM|nr:TetR/AcrR family transcriptional regulator [Parendozoicomonas haliclonae]SMA48879.1 HTH-type transcriptional repressor AcnR [Parendozoicomonas haliclonae]